MSKRRIAPALALVFALLGCDPAGALLGRDAADVNTMRELWDAQGIDDYYVEITQSNEWVPAYTIGIEVRNGEATRVRGSLQEPNSSWRSPDQWERQLVVDSLYTRLATALANPELVVISRFDTRLGVPTVLHFDMPLWADDSYGIEIKRLVRQ